ncbi:MAG: sensor histidine kinase [Thermoanaerobaculia bacterium]
MIQDLPSGHGSPAALSRLRGSLGARVFMVLVGVLLLAYFLYGGYAIQRQKKDMEQATLHNGELISDVLLRSLSFSMLRNDREALMAMVKTVKGEPGIIGVRIFDRLGGIRYSGAPDEIGASVSTRSPSCSVCHREGKPKPNLPRSERFRIFRAGDERVLGVITPIPNSPACSNAACHAHPADQQILGVLDMTLSLSETERSIAAGARALVIWGLVSVLIVAALGWIFVYRMVHRRVRSITHATGRLAAGDLGYQIAVRGSDELATLSHSFNRMSRELKDAREEITDWGRNLETRVEQKTAELSEAHVQMMQAEKMASLGKLAAVVAHEINNPLSGILTYARLLRRWLGTPEGAESHREDSLQSLALIESESRRCGDIVRNLLSFARETPMHLTAVPIESVIEQCARLLEHKMELSGIAFHRRIEKDLPQVLGDAAQLEQILLALMINAIDAMQDGGNLTVSAENADGELRLVVEDDGCGIPDEVLSRIFEPFVTTKESGGVGLGLAISQGIVDRHRGRIDVDSAVGRGTRFTIRLPFARTAEPALPAHEVI